MAKYAVLDRYDSAYAVAFSLLIPERVRYVRGKMSVKSPFENISPRKLISFIESKYPPRQIGSNGLFMITHAPEGEPEFEERVRLVNGQEILETRSIRYPTTIQFYRHLKILLNMSEEEVLAEFVLAKLK